MTTTITLNNTEIERLITCPKIFKTAPPKLPTLQNRNLNLKFKVYSADSDDEFLVFFSRSAKMLLDFSLGLRYDNFLLYRCNGFHGTTKSGFYSAPHHAYPHAHILSETDIEQGRSLKPSNCQDLTGKYIDFAGAVTYFSKKCGIMNYTKYVSDIFQNTLF